MMAEAKAEDSALSASENSVQETDAQKSIASTGLNATVAEVMDPIDVRMLNLTDDSECNSEELRKIVLDVRTLKNYFLLFIFVSSKSEALI